MKVKNKDLLISGDALTELAGKDLDGRFALRLKRLIPKFNESLEEVREIRSEMDVGSKADKEMLEDEFELPGTGEKFPEKAIYDIQIRPVSLLDLEWLFNFQGPRPGVRTSRQNVLSSRVALENVSRARLPGQFVRHLKYLIDQAPAIYKKSQDFSESEDPSKEEREAFLEEEVSLPSPVLPEEAISRAENISAYTIDKLDWLFEV